MIRIDLALSPFMDSFLDQNPMSLLKASMSNTVCSSETAVVSPRNQGFVSKNIRFSSSLWDLVLSPSLSCSSQLCSI